MKQVIIIVIGVLVIVFAFIYVSQIKSDTSTTTMTRTEAIRQAEEYQPTEDCIDALTPAVHRETGAKYTFPSGCLAPGWEPDE